MYQILCLNIKSYVKSNYYKINISNGIVMSNLGAHLFLKETAFGKRQIIFILLSYFKRNELMVTSRQENTC